MPYDRWGAVGSSRPSAPLASGALTAQVALLNTKPDKGKAEARVDYGKMADALQHKLDGVKKRPQELNASSDEAWEDFKAGSAITSET